MAVAVVVAVAERVNGVDALEKNVYKNGVIHPTVLVACVVDVEALWPLNANANANDVGVGWRVERVDFKKGFQLLTDKEMWKSPSKAEEKKVKRWVADYKREYHASGTRDSYNKWLVKKGYA